MSSSPRLRRGTSVIAALVFAAILGAVALGLHAIDSNSTNTSALQAQAAAAVQDSSTQTCKEGQDYNLTIGAPPSTTAITPEGQAITYTTGEIPGVQNTPVQICPTGAQVYTNAQKTYLHISTGGGTTGTLPPTLSSNQANAPSFVQPLASRNQCTSASAAPSTSASTSKVVCKYSLSGSTYQLQTTQEGGGPWTCNVTFYDPNGSPECWQKQVPMGGGVNDTAPGNPGAGTSSGTALTPTNGTCPTGYSITYPDGYDAQCTPTTAGSTNTSNTSGLVTPDSEGYISTTNCAGSAYEGGFSCTDVTAQQAQTQLQQATGQSYSCAADPSSPSDSVSCTPSAITNTPANPNAQTTQTCTNGATNYPTCTPSAQVPPPGGAQTQTQIPAAPANPNGNTNNNSGLGALTSFLSGLARGLSPCTAQSSSIGGNGTTLVPQTIIQPNGTYTTVYVQQSTTQPGSSPCTPQQPTQSAPYGVGTNGVACSMPPTQPQCATGATAEPIYGQGNGCVTSYQCVNINGSTISSSPTPQISCSPQVADVGQSIAISYSCQNATGSSGGGFSTNNQLSGSASSTITAPPSGTNTANFGLTCNNSGVTASAQCSVQINQPAIDLVTNPQAVPSGKTATIGWVTAGMQSCVISSPDDATFTSANASNTSVSGVAQSDPITASTEFDLTCQTLGGETKVAKTTVTVGSASSTTPVATSTASVSINSSVDGQTANHGGAVSITWQSSNVPAGSALALWLINVNTEQASALIAGAQPTSGSYEWQIPAAGSSCNSSSVAVCASSLVAGDAYGIEAAVYTPSDANLGDGSEPSSNPSPSYNGYGYSPTPFTIGQ